MKLKLALPVILLLGLVLLNTAATAGLGWTVETIGPCRGYTSIALDSNDHPHISYLVSSLEVTYAYWDSTTWYTETVGLSNASYAAYTSIVLDGDDHPHICYPGGDVDLKYAYKDTTGWHVEEVTSEGGSEGDFCSIALDSNGYPHISYYDYATGPDPADKNLKYAYKDGTGWHIESVGDTSGHTSLALDSNNYPHISYSFVDNGYYLGYAYKNASGWHMDSLGYGGRHTSLVLDVDDYPHISHHISSPDYDLQYTYQDASGWHTVTVDSTGIVGRYTSLALDGSGYPHISYYDYTLKDLNYAYEDTSGWHTVTVDSTGDVGEDTSIALDSEGYAHISYNDKTNDVLKHAYSSYVLEQYDLTVTKTGAGSGTVESDPPAIDCGLTCTAQFTEGAVVTLTATADIGSAFTGWSGDPDCLDGQVVMDADRACTATFVAFRIYLPMMLKQ